MRVNLGASAYASTGEKGTTVDRIIVEPETWTATHIVLAKGKPLASSKLVPISLVERWTEDSVVLRVSFDDLVHLPDYIARQYSTPRQLLPRPRRATGKNVPARELFTPEGTPYGPGIFPHETQPAERPATKEEPVESGRIQLRDGETVEATDGEFGRLDQLLLDVYTNRISSLVVLVNEQRVDVPVEWVAYIDPDRIRLAATGEQAKRLVGPPAGNYLSELPDQGRSSEREPGA